MKGSDCFRGRPLFLNKASFSIRDSLGSKGFPVFLSLSRDLKCSCIAELNMLWCRKFAYYQGRLN